MDTSKEYQLKKGSKLTSIECEEFYKAIQISKEDRLYIDTPIGKQVADWLVKKSRYQNIEKINTQFQSFISPVDGSEIRCNAGLREHQKKHGVRQVGSDL